MRKFADDKEQEKWIADIYNETAKKIANYSPQLFVYKNRETQEIQSHGSSILLEAGRSHYMITARHCIFQDDKIIAIGVLCNGKGHLKLIKGWVAAEKGEHDDIDVAIIKLHPETVAFLQNCYTFLPIDSVRQNSNIPDSTDYLVFGHTISRTNINNSTRRLKLAPFLYISKSAEADKYTALRFKEEKTKLEYYHNKANTLLLGFDKRRSKFIGEEEMHMSPNPKGISGCGVWYIQSYELNNPADAEFSLMGIIIEHDSVKRLLISTRSEVLINTLQRSIFMFGN